MTSIVKLEKRQEEEVADRVLRRAQVSKMTRALQDRLASANVKIQHGHNRPKHRSIDSLPHGFENEMKRKRNDSNADLFSDTSSSVSGRCFSTGVPMSSPLTAPILSDHISHGSIKRPRAKGPSFVHPSQTQHRNKARGRGQHSVQNTWKNTYQLPQSSPIRQQSQPRPSTRRHQQPSFASQTSTIFDSPSASEDDDQDLPLHSFQMFQESTSNIPSSPPRTPSPSFSRSASLRGQPFSPTSNNRYAGKEGADLLLYLASSPSPAAHIRDSSSMQPPSTPPSSRTPLPSSMMNTPGGQALFGLGTPNAGFNFADFVNVTPSPAQRRWPATPVGRTPLTSRKRDNLMLPPTSTSPNMLRSTMRKEAGLGMELGGNLHH